MGIYTSTRSDIETSISKAIVKGIADDGGLFVPKNINDLKLDYKSLVGKSYKEIAFAVFRLFFDDFSDEEIRYCIDGAYTDSFKTSEVVEISKVANFYELELYHGPTCAFKDVALQFLPFSMQVSKKKNDIDSKVMILTATSGDTGKAALEGFKNIDGIDITVFYPKGKVSDIQEKQMVSTDGKNTHVASINGNFDDCQRIVKDIFADKEVEKELADKGIILSSANSINISRLLPQVVYYVYSYIKLLERNEIEEDELINFTVPTGNFGNILAGLYAKRIGVPINKLICASNSNNVLTEFLKTGVYDRNREFYKTISPSMDILVSSNVERLIYEIAAHKQMGVSKKMEDLKTSGRYELCEHCTASMKEDFYADYTTDEQCLEEIKNTLINDHKLIDTHTACASSVYRRYVEETGDSTKTVVVSTASPYKFSKDVLRALVDEIPANEYECIKKLNEISKEEIPSSIAELQNKEVKHNTNLNIDEALNYVLALAEGK